MTISIFIAILTGILVGLFIMPEFLYEYMNLIINIGLCILLFFVGIDIGSNKGIVKKMKKIGYRVFLVPLAIAIGSIFGTIVMGILLDFKLNEAAAIGAGFGWYSLSAVILSNHCTYLGTVAFVTNISREIIALLSIPYIAKYIGKLETIAPAGATAMDVALPLISKTTNGNIAIISFITGVLLSSMVPILVSIFMLFS